MRHLIETGVLFERDGRWASALTPDEIGVPEGVKEVLASRLGRLSEGCRAPSPQAAVLGREFSFDVLRAMAELDEDALIAALEEAVDAQLIVEASGRRPGYAFTHALVRETLYGSAQRPAPAADARARRRGARAAARARAGADARRDRLPPLRGRSRRGRRRSCDHADRAGGRVGARTGRLRAGGRAPHARAHARPGQTTASAAGGSGGRGRSPSNGSRTRRSTCCRRSPLQRLGCPRLGSRDRVMPDGSEARSRAHARRARSRSAASPPASPYQA